MPCSVERLIGINKEGLSWEPLLCCLFLKATVDLTYSSAYNGQNETVVPRAIICSFFRSCCKEKTETLGMSLSFFGPNPIRDFDQETEPPKSSTLICSCSQQQQFTYGINKVIITITVTIIIMFFVTAKTTCCLKHLPSLPVSAIVSTAYK